MYTTWTLTCWLIHIDAYVFLKKKQWNSLGKCITSTVPRLGRPLACKAKLQAVMLHQAPNACFCGVGLHEDFVDSWTPQELEFNVSVLEDRDGSWNISVIFGLPNTHPWCLKDLEEFLCAKFNNLMCHRMLHHANAAVYKLYRTILNISNIDIW